MCVSDFYIECMKVWFFYCFPYLNKCTTCIKVTLPQQGPLMNADMLNGDRTGVLEYSSIASAIVRERVLCQNYVLAVFHSFSFHFSFTSIWATVLSGQGVMWVMMWKSLTLTKWCYSTHKNHVLLLIFLCMWTHTK